MNDQSQVTAVVQQHVGIPRFAVLQNGLFDTPFVFFLGFTLPGEYRNAVGSHGRSGVVLGRENVARRPANFRPELG